MKTWGIHGEAGHGREEGEQKENKRLKENKGIEEQEAYKENRGNTRIKEKTKITRDIKENKGNTRTSGGRELHFYVATNSSYPSYLVMTIRKTQFYVSTISLSPLSPTLFNFAVDTVSLNERFQSLFYPVPMHFVQRETLYARTFASLQHSSIGLQESE